MSRESTPRTVGSTTVKILVLYVVIVAVVVAWGWFLTHSQGAGIDRFDDELARDIEDQRSSGLDRWAEIGTLMGETIVTLVISPIVAIGMWIWQRSVLPALFVALAVCGVGGIYFAGTELDPRDRPPVKLLDAGLVPDASFPSGHVGTATTLAGLIIVLTWVYARRARWPVLLLALVPISVIAARLYEGAHHLSDTLTSVTYSCAWLAALAVLVLGYRKRSGGTSSRSSSHAATSAS